MQLSRVQKSVLQRLAAGEHLYSMAAYGGDGHYFFAGTSKALNARTINKLEEAKLIRSEYKMGTGSSDYFLTEAGQKAVAV